MQVDEQVSSNPDSDLGEYSILSNSVHKSSPPITVEVNMSGQPVTMELDTGAAASVMSNSTFKKLFPRLRVHRSSLVLNTYSGHVLKVLGEVLVDVAYLGRPAKPLSLVVVDGDDSNTPHSPEPDQEEPPVPPTLSVRLLIVTRDDIELLRSISVSVMERTELSGEECGKLRLMDMYFVLCMHAMLLVIVSYY